MSGESDPVKVALLIDALLQRETPAIRNQVLEWLWFTYVGRQFDWYKCRLVRRSDDDLPART